MLSNGHIQMHTELIKYRLFTFLAVLILSCGIMSSCDEVNPPIPLFDLPETKDLPTLKDAHGYVAAVREVSLVQQSGFNIVKTIGEASGAFIDQTDQSKLTYAGAITVNGAYLGFLEDSTYFFDLDLTNSIGTVFSEDIEWEIEGGNGYPYIKKNISGWPDVLTITSSKAIDIRSSYDLTTQEINFADTTIFQIAGPNGLVYAEKGGDDISHTFSKEELQTLGTGLGVMQISAFRLRDTLIDDRKIYFIMGNSFFETVNIQ